MKIDLHNHTTLSSRCSRLDVRDLITRAMSMELDAVCVTEHDTLEGGRHARDIGREMGFTVIPGQEVSAHEGDILAFGMESDGLYGIGLDELCRIAEAENAVLIPAHPYRRMVNAVGNLMFDYGACFVAVEGLNGNCSPDENWSAQVAAEKMALPVTGGSDAHVLGKVGMYYTLFDESLIIEDVGSLVRALRSGRFSAAKNELYSMRRTI